MSTERPFVSICMPCLNEEAYIEACLGSVLAQSYPNDRFEILVGDGGSTDRTRAIVERIAERDSRVRLLDNPDRIQAAGMNRMIRASRGDVIVRMDVHCEYAEDYVDRAVNALERSGADNAGGAQRARAKTTFQKALCAALQSPLGVGGVKYRGETNEGFVETVFLGAFKREVFRRVGMYDPKAATNEDAELNQRILESGGKVFLARDVVVHYFPRADFRSLSKQYFRYGKGRARTLLKHGRFPSIRPVVPFLLTLGGTALAATSAWQPFTLPAFASYAALTGAEAIRVGRHAGIAAIPIVWCIFPVLHASHGVGFAVGLVTYALAPDWGSPEILEPAAISAS